MNNLRHLLQDADPIRLEAPLGDTRREQMRREVLSNVSTNRPTTALRGRLTFAGAIVLAIVGIVALGDETWIRGTTPVSAAVRFEVRLAEDTPIQGSTVVKNADRMLYLHPEIVVSNDDVVQSWVSQDGDGRFGVQVQLSQSGADRLRQATAAHVGRPVAILIDGNVVMAPVVRSPMSDSAWISGDFTRGEAERIAAGMRLQ